MATGLTAAATPTNAKPALTWTSGGADALSGFARYDIYRGAVLAGSSATPAFTDTALSTSGSYSYTVKTIDNAGNAVGRVDRQDRHLRRDRAARPRLDSPRPPRPR